MTTQSHNLFLCPLQLEFGLNVAGYAAANVGAAQETAICNAITAASGLVSPGELNEKSQPCM
jgi:hypothetical protein